ncbi:cupin domain-containing protein [Salipiger sp. IMCC34102]|uniref:cupin domain-containing protein n=1 Tax=Salipiger sp. IMCC34102 TaxID=2510647 RepID=UPI00101DA388|nr:cupin domain-containing protein [Salipiger sp. IMCC34102]RYH03622.1 cupin domain-containing protein [Salipiger sp. IMCC34102]
MGTAQLISYLDLAPHPEGGWFRETWMVAAQTGHRPAATGIYYLLAGNDRSRWHRIDCSEIWMFHAGAPLEISISPTEAGPARDVLLGSELGTPQLPQVEVEPFHWQSARTTGDWTLCSCICAPGFLYETLEIAEPGFDIPRA